MPTFFEYSKTQTDHLARRCPEMGRAIAAIGPIQRAVMPDLFEALVHAIVSQQIANKARDTVWARILQQFGPVTPLSMANADADALQQCGMSMRKVGYIQNAAREAVSGRLDLAALTALPDAEVAARLSALPGIGVWTAEMLLLFSMQRQDILSFGDLAIHRGLCMLYDKEKLSRRQFATYAELYSPYASVASLYLWHIAAHGVAPAAE